jgi:hypothetical protein
MICEGFEQAAHEVDTLHAKNLCPHCYQKKYRAENIVKLSAYQKEYRADPAYRELNIIYIRVCRERKTC